MVESVDTGDLKSPAPQRRAGSSPAPGTMKPALQLVFNCRESKQTALRASGLERRSYVRSGLYLPRRTTRRDPQFLTNKVSLETVKSSPAPGTRIKLSGSKPIFSWPSVACLYLYSVVHSGAPTFPPLAQLVEQLALNQTVLGSSPRGRTSDKNFAILASLARVAKLVDARGLGPRGAIRGGSSPLPRTK